MVMLVVMQYTRMDTSKSGSERINGYVTDTREISRDIGVAGWTWGKVLDFIQPPQYKRGQL